RRGKYRNGHALLAGDFALDERFIAGLHEPQKADSTQTRKVRVHVQRMEECSEFSRLDLSTAGMKHGLRRAQQRKMKIAPAFNPVQRVVRRGRKFYARRLLRGEIGKAGHCQACQRDGHEGDDGQESFQLRALSHDTTRLSYQVEATTPMVPLREALALPATLQAVRRRSSRRRAPVLRRAGICRG